MVAADVGLKAWKLDFEGLANDKQRNLDPPGYDAAIGKEVVGQETSNCARSCAAARTRSPGP